MARICFLFNHDQTHQLAHGLPIALRMIEDGHHDVTLAVSSAMIEAEIRRQAGDRLGRATVVRLRLESIPSKFAAKLLDRWVPASKILLYRDHLDFFRNFDALVVSEKTSLILKTRYKLPNLKIIHTRHGAGDRAIGFNKASAGFDLVLVSGPKIRDRLIAEAGVDPQQIAIVGYPKFEQCEGNRADIPFANPALPTVIYNPHPSPHLSSWHSMGAAVLAAFAQQPARYNLIFAPHVMLFSRAVTVTIDKLSAARVQPPDPAYGSLPNIHIDLGSGASSDMRYTNRADLYLGDVSSQIYEFLVHPRPCLFLNAHGVDWAGDPNYAHWQAGPVLDDAGRIMAAVAQAFASHGDYMPMQQRLLASTFSVTTDLPSRRAADAIGRLLAGEAQA